jgi:hypothetical protein
VLHVLYRDRSSGCVTVSAGCGGMFLSTAAEWRIGDGSPVVPAKARAGQFWALTGGLTVLMSWPLVLRLRSVSPFTSGRFQHRSYCGSAATLKEEAVKATFSSPPLRRTISPAAYTFGLPTIGRRRASPVMAQDPFSPGGNTQHLHGSPPLTACAAERGHQASPTLHRKGGDWRPMSAEMPSPGVSPPGPFATASSPDLPVRPPWLHTPAPCGVRAGSSVRVRTRTGRIWRFATPPFFTSPFVHR